MLNENTEHVFSLFTFTLSTEVSFSSFQLFHFGMIRQLSHTFATAVEFIDSRLVIDKHQAEANT